MDGTDSETALGKRAEENAALDRMSRMRQLGSLINESKLSGRTGEKDEDGEELGWVRGGGDERDMEAMGAAGGAGMFRDLGLGGLSRAGEKSETEEESNLLSIARANEEVSSTWA